jgi:hypothetical protein
MGEGINLGVVIKLGEELGTSDDLSTLCPFVADFLGLALDLDLDFPFAFLGILYGRL